MALRAPDTHDGHGGGPEDMEEVGSQAVSLISVLIVNTALTPSQRPLRASLTASVSFLMVRAGETVEAILVAVFSHSRRHVQNCADDPEEEQLFRDLREETQGKVLIESLKADCEVRTGGATLE